MTVSASNSAHFETALKLGSKVRQMAIANTDLNNGSGLLTEDRPKYLMDALAGGFLPIMWTPTVPLRRI
ncbi:protein of unknown function [Candidatus Filomicrobium marinum]|uniref:Uncharacterized protein n=1 Tax=Candidatus Filomicrobium marinum TaxID=1608628 RepID=A0A0D6JD90_9HYPH|nr:protein of unknown function [Candidatus Filomicrobium marinum]CPR17142.1 protein of unknown function [Candidatus Filomicrobium marinum]